jgi:hypothetical protein
MQQRMLRLKFVTIPSTHHHLSLNNRAAVAESLLRLRAKADQSVRELVKSFLEEYEVIRE